MTTVVSITFDQSDTVIGTIRKVEAVNLSLLDRDLPEGVRTVLNNLGTCLAFYLREIKSREADRRSSAWQERYNHELLQLLGGRAR